MSDFKLESGKVTDLEKDENLGSLADFLEEEFSAISMFKQTLLKYTDTHHSGDSLDKLRKQIVNEAESHFTNFFEKNNGEVSYEDLDKEISKHDRNFYKKHQRDIENLILEHINSIFSKPKTGGTNMFKNLKEAKLFTAHLDELASEIQGLEGVGQEMKMHLAYRLDKLSDLIESSASHKEASVSKEANGVGQGAWAYDKDEARYMSTMGGTGALQHDADESYMKEFKGDDHMEVLKRKEPSTIQGAGAKAKQPSDNYNQAEVANKLRSYVKNALAKVK